ncbi:hypothetical protein D6829_00905 [Candidatus Pacearchaeota archaeon]|nr:MAG: hypothetical protein D6829_00905 [Candidatus Pacearchaeota archaeon]
MFEITEELVIKLDNFKVFKGFEQNPKLFILKSSLNFMENEGEEIRAENKGPKKLITFSSSEVVKTESKPQAKKVKPLPQIKYPHARPFFGRLKEFPKEFVPTHITAYLMMGMFLAFIILSLLNFPFGKLIAGQTNAEINVGYPLVFLKLGTSTVGKFPLSIWRLLIDLLVYFLVAYILGVLYNLAVKYIVGKLGEDSERPVVFRVRPKEEQKPAQPKVQNMEKAEKESVKEGVKVHEI